MDDLVRVTGSSRHALYAEFGGKRDLFLACFAPYRDQVVSPAFAQVEAPGAGLPQIAAYFETQIARAETAGLPGPGCLVANTATELAPHDPDAAAEVARHNARLAAGFANALRNDELAYALVVFATGLWSLSRVTDDADGLRRAVKLFLASITKEPRP